MNSTSRSDALGLVGDLNPPPTLMPTARLLTNGALGGGLKHAKDETDN
ncbi:MAG: hypothetical protein KME57_14085 [Scytonema hyalinum WJT4-NPBG1]|nr:hypothetical protein [Scytonema hyalinum WJT4-NPBG1]